MSPASYRAAPPRVGETTIPQFSSGFSEGGGRAATTARPPGSPGRAGGRRLPRRGLVRLDRGLQVRLRLPDALEVPVALRGRQRVEGGVDLADGLVPRRVVRATVGRRRGRGRRGRRAGLRRRGAAGRRWR